MSEDKTGGSAFPVPYDSEQDGITIRDYFAANASDDDIKEIISNMPRVEKVFENDNGMKHIGVGLPDNARQTARYIHADAMLAERDKGE